jgi:sugar/nucleoside kinase (ribokinase family)
MPEIEAARFASAAGALCATKLGGREGLPTLRELEEFVARQG